MYHKKSRHTKHFIDQLPWEDFLHDFLPRVVELYPPFSAECPPRNSIIYTIHESNPWAQTAFGGGCGSGHVGFLNGNGRSEQGQSSQNGNGRSSSNRQLGDGHPVIGLNVLKKWGFSSWTPANNRGIVTQ
jgi:hypothetical protein